MVGYRCWLLLLTNAPSQPQTLAPSGPSLRRSAPEPESWPVSARYPGSVTSVPSVPSRALDLLQAAVSLPCAQPSGGAPAAPSVSRCALDYLGMCDLPSFLKDCFTRSEDDASFSPFVPVRRPFLWPLAAPSSSAFSDWLLVASLCPVSQLCDCVSGVQALFFFSRWRFPSVPVHGV